MIFCKMKILRKNEHFQNHENFGKKYKDFTKEVKDFCKKYKGIHFIDSSKVPLSGSFKSGEIKMTRSNWQKILIEKVESTKLRQELPPAPDQRKDQVIERLEKKSPPYGTVELNEISLRAYTSPFIRGFSERWKINKDVLEDINDNTVDVLEQL